MLLLTHKTAHGVYNLAGQNGITSKEIAEIIAASLGCGAVSVSLEEAQKLWGPFVAHGISINSQADWSKAFCDLGWEPLQTNFEQEVGMRFKQSLLKQSSN